MREADRDAARQTRAFEQARAEAAALAARMDELRLTSHRTRQALQDQGVDVTRLASEYLRLRQAEQQARRDQPLRADAEQLNQRYRDPAQVLAERRAALDAHLAAGRISQETYNRALADMNRNLQEGERNTNRLGAALRTMGHIAAGLTIGYQAFGLGRETFQTGIEFQRIDGLLKNVTGSTQAAEQMQWLEKISGQLGLSVATVAESYAFEHKGPWTNRLIQGDSLQVINSLLEYEGLGGQVQMIYMDPPYGVKFGSNFQPFVRKRDVKHGKDEEMIREPEMVKAYRDTWELGLHSYLTYLRDRLLLARELLTESGSIFVQISDENLHHVKEVMDEIFGTGNLCAVIPFKKTSGQASSQIAGICDFLIWFSKDKSKAKYLQLYASLGTDVSDDSYSCIEFEDGNWRRPEIFRVIIASTVKS